MIINFRKQDVTLRNPPEKHDSYRVDVSEALGGQVLAMAALAAAAAGISPEGNPDNPDDELADPIHREISMSTDSCLASLSDVTSASSCSSPSGGGSHHSAGSSSAEESNVTTSRSSNNWTIHSINDHKRGMLRGLWKNIVIPDNQIS